MSLVLELAGFLSLIAGCTLVGVLVAGLIGALAAGLLSLGLVLLVFAAAADYVAGGRSPKR